MRASGPPAASSLAAASRTRRGSSRCLPLAALALTLLLPRLSSGAEPDFDELNRRITIMGGSHVDALREGCLGTEPAPRAAGRTLPDVLFDLEQRGSAPALAREGRALLERLRASGRERAEKIRSCQEALERWRLSLGDPVAGSAARQAEQEVRACEAATPSAGGAALGEAKACLLFVREAERRLAGFGSPLPLRLDERKEQRELLDFIATCDDALSCTLVPQAFRNVDRGWLGPVDVHGSVDFVDVDGRRLVYMVSLQIPFPTCKEALAQVKRWRSGIEAQFGPSKVSILDGDGYAETCAQISTLIFIGDYAASIVASTSDDEFTANLFMNYLPHSMVAFSKDDHVD